jgi:integrase
MESVTPETILVFLTESTKGNKQSTKHLWHSVLSGFFNFIENTIDPEVQNPCDTPMLKKLFKDPKPNNWEILEKDLVDEIIFRTENLRNRVMLELMARGGLRVGEVLKLTPSDIVDRKVIIRDPKSGREDEVAFIPQKVADRLKRYIVEKEIKPHERIFPITPQAARIIVRKAGNLVGIHLRPHDLRRHAATFASRAGTPIEIVSKVILRHANLSITKSFNCIPTKSKR